MAGNEHLCFAFLVYLDRSKKWGETWIARSILTGHIAESLSADGAIENLQKTVGAAVYAAGQIGQSAAEWYRSQTIDDVQYLETFARLTSMGQCILRESKLDTGNCKVSTSVATKAA